MSRPHRRKHGSCARCRKVGSIPARRLCTSCYKSVTADGTREDWPRYQRAGADVVAAVERLRSQGVRWKPIAERLGYSTGHVAANTYRQAKRHLASSLP